jgi:MFS family permease
MLARAVSRDSGLAKPLGKNRTFRMLLAGSSVSLLGSRVTTIGYPMLVLYLTGSPVDAGWVAFAATAPSVLVYMPAGALVDRWDPRRVMLLSEIGRGLAISSVVAMMALGGRSIAVLVVAAFVEEILEVFSTLAERRYVRIIVPREQASSAQVRIEARTHAAVLIGRPLGGLLFEFRPIAPFIADVATFFVSVATLLSIKMQKTAWCITSPSTTMSAVACARPGGNYLYRQLKNDIFEGIRWLRLDQFARSAVTLSAATTLICQAIIMIFLAVAHSRQLSSVALGVVLSTSGLGGVFGSLIASRLPAPSRRTWIQVQMQVWAVALAILAISGGVSVFWMGLVMTVLGFTGALGNIEVGTYLSHHVAENMLARVVSIRRLLSFTACAIGPVIGGVLYQCFGTQDAIYLLFAMTAFLAIYSVFVPSVCTRRSDVPDILREFAPGESVSILRS